MKSLRLFLSCLLLAASFCAGAQQEPVEGEPAHIALLQQALQRLEERKPQEALEALDQLIAAYEAKYKDGGKRVYEARSSPEGLLYLMMAAKDNQSAVLAKGVWGEAYYVKGYTLIELNRLDDAKPVLERAIAISPRNSKFIGELGHIYQTRSDWPNALATFTDAEEAAREFSPPQAKVREWTRALRGSGYVLVELGRLDEAEAKYRKCLELDKNDQKALGELRYIEEVRQKKAAK
jgi:Flp pilus assembly protein TadD